MNRIWSVVRTNSPWATAQQQKCILILCIHFTQNRFVCDIRNKKTIYTIYLSQMYHDNLRFSWTGHIYRYIHIYMCCVCMYCVHNTIWYWQWAEGIAGTIFKPSCRCVWLERSKSSTNENITIAMYAACCMLHVFSTVFTPLLQLLWYTEIHPQAAASRIYSINASFLFLRQTSNTITSVYNFFSASFIASSHCYFAVSCAMKRCTSEDPSRGTSEYMHEFLYISSHHFSENIVKEWIGSIRTTCYNDPLFAKIGTIW